MKVKSIGLVSIRLVAPNGGIARKLIALAGVTVALTTVSTSAGPTSPTYVAKMFIASGSEYPLKRVLPVGNPEYLDYRLEGDPAGANYCVSGDVASTGGVFMVLNRRLTAGGTHCSDASFPARQFTLLIEDPVACDRLGSAIPEGSESCQFTTPENELQQIKPGEIFKSKVTKTNVTFYFSFNGVDYRIQTNTLATVTAVPTNGNSRIVSYSGAVTLSDYQPHPTGYVPFASFSLPFTMQFDRVPTIAP